MLRFGLFFMTQNNEIISTLQDISQNNGAINSLNLLLKCSLIKNNFFPNDFLYHINGGVKYGGKRG